MTTINFEKSQEILDKEKNELESHRNYFLKFSDWTQLEDAPLTNSCKTEWKRWRAELRKLDAITDDNFIRKLHALQSNIPKNKYTSKPSDLNKKIKSAYDIILWKKIPLKYQMNFENKFQEMIDYKQSNMNIENYHHLYIMTLTYDKPIETICEELIQCRKQWIKNLQEAELFLYNCQQMFEDKSKHDLLENYIDGYRY